MNLISTLDSTLAKSYAEMGGSSLKLRHTNVTTVMISMETAALTTAILRMAGLVQVATVPHLTSAQAFAETC